MVNEAKILHKLEVMNVCRRKDRLKEGYHMLVILVASIKYHG